jgi:hypothetical protein
MKGVERTKRWLTVLAWSRRARLRARPARPTSQSTRVASATMQEQDFDSVLRAAAGVAQAEAEAMGLAVSQGVLDLHAQCEEFFDA